MSWSVNWDVTSGARGAVFGDEDNTVYQHEHVRFVLRLRGTNQRARDFVLDAHNWSEAPRMHVTGLDAEGNDIRIQTVEVARDDLLAFDYAFEWDGPKRIEFSGQVDLRLAQADLHGDTGVRTATMHGRAPVDYERFESDVYATYPTVALTIPFEVVERSTTGGARATTSGDGPTARARARLIEGESGVAASERDAAADAEAHDRGSRDRRARRARRGVGRGVVRLPSPWTHLLTDDELDELDEATMDAYSRDLQAAIRMTPPVSMNGNEYSDGSHVYRGHWTWAYDDNEIVFYFLATQILIEGAGGRMRVCADDEAANVREHSGRDRRFGREEWIVAILPGERRKVFAHADAFAHDVDWTRLVAFVEFVDVVMTAFDVVELVTGVGAIVAGLRRAARWLVNNAARVARRALATAARHPDDLARGARRALAHTDDAARTSGDAARGIGGTTRAGGRDAARGLAPGTSGSAGEVARSSASATGIRVAEGTADAARATGDEARGLASGPPDLVDDAFDAMTDGARMGAALPPPPVPYTPTRAARALLETARAAFSRLQRTYARALGLTARSGAQVHHAIELSVIVRYGPDVFSVEELNALRNMRGIVPERTLADTMSARTGLRQLHNSAIRRRWDAAYARIDRVIAEERLIAATPAYRARVRDLLESGRDAIDDEFGAFFSGSGARLEAGLGRGGRGDPLLDWSRSGMLRRDLGSLGDAARTGTALDLPPALRP